MGLGKSLAGLFGMACVGHRGGDLAQYLMLSSLAP